MAARLNSQKLDLVFGSRPDILEGIKVAAGKTGLDHTSWRPSELAPSVPEKTFAYRPGRLPGEGKTVQ
jgi:hypothetical protein